MNGPDKFGQGSDKSARPDGHGHPLKGVVRTVRGSRRRPGPKRSANPSPSALRSRQSYELHNKLGCGFCEPIVSGEVLAMLIRAGKLANRESHEPAEIDRAVTEFLFTLADDKIKLGRVLIVMADRWQGLDR